MKKRVKPTNEFVLHKGRQVDAVYIPSNLEEFEGNPLIEALPSMWDEKQVIKMLNGQIDFKESHLALSPKERFLKIQAALKSFVTLDVHLQLEEMLAIAIRSGLQSRNPYFKEYWAKRKTEVVRFDQYADQYDYEDDDISWTAAGFTVVGMSGVGKSRSILRILNLYPQIINHRRYLEKIFTLRQLVWLKIECPQNGSRVALCKSFLRAVDAILKTDYYMETGSVEDYLEALATVAANHFLGILVIDEVQRLRLAKSGDDKQMLNFFVKLINEIGVPVVLVGTYKAISVISTEFAQMRRSAGQSGDLVWHRMEKDDQWDLFVEALWKCQYLKTKTPLDQKLKDALYDESQGITDFAVKIYGFAQRRAMDTDSEKITVSIIRSVAKDHLNIPRAVLNALKSGDTKVLQEFEDVYPKTLTQDFFRATYNDSRSDNDLRSEKQPQAKNIVNTTTVGKDDQNVKIKKGEGKIILEIKPSFAKKDVESTPQKTESAKRKKNDGKRQIMEHGLPPGILPKSDSVINSRKLMRLTANLSKKNNIAAYEALLKGGYIRHSDEFTV